MHGKLNCNLKSLGELISFSIPGSKGSGVTTDKHIICSFTGGGSNQRSWEVLVPCILSLPIPNTVLSKIYPHSFETLSLWPPNVLHDTVSLPEAVCKSHTCSQRHFISATRGCGGLRSHCLSQGYQLFNVLDSCSSLLAPAVFTPWRPDFFN